MQHIIEMNIIKNYQDPIKFTSNSHLLVMNTVHMLVQPFCM